jgi:hypothetical protein
MIIKKEISFDPGTKADFIRQMLNSGYFLYVSRDDNTLVFKRRFTLQTNSFESAYKKLNPLNYINAHVSHTKITLVVHCSRIIFAIIMLNTVIAGLLLLAGMNVKGPVFLAVIFAILEVLIVYLQVSFTLDSIISKIRSLDLGKQPR